MFIPDCRHSQLVQVFLLFSALRNRASGIVFLVLLTAAVSGVSPTLLADEADPPFIRVEGAQFMRGDQPYYFAGVNFWYGAYLGAPGPGGDRARLRRELDQLKALGLTNLRVLAVSEKSELTMTLHPAIQIEPGQLEENLLQGLDFLLAEMAERDMQAVLFLNNYWQWSGGMAQYVSWVTGEPVVDPDVSGDWDTFIANSARFYGMPKAQSYFRQIIEAVITRRNTVNGRRYNEDPTIMTWELANEPRPGRDPSADDVVASYLQWVKATAAYIHHLAPHQLVTTGNEGEKGSVDSIELWRRTHALDEIDYLTFHLWPKNWSWFEVSQAEATYAKSEALALDYVDRHIAIAQQVGKPVVLEEFGLERDGADYRPQATTRWRDQLFAALFQRVESLARSGSPVAGTNIWSWGGEGRPASDDFVWREGDDFMGDPPQEPQGLNSVYDSDTSTLSLLRAHAAAMQALVAEPAKQARIPFQIQR